MNGYRTGKGSRNVFVKLYDRAKTYKNKTNKDREQIEFEQN
jgi:hypothetical protein